MVRHHDTQPCGTLPVESTRPLTTKSIPPPPPSFRAPHVILAKARIHKRTTAVIPCSPMSFRAERGISVPFATAQGDACERSENAGDALPVGIPLTPLRKRRGDSEHHPVIPCTPMSFRAERGISPAERPSTGERQPRPHPSPLMPKGEQKGVYQGAAGGLIALRRRRPSGTITTPARDRTIKQNAARVRPTRAD